MHGSLAASRSSKAKGWVLVILAAAILATLFVIADLGSQFRMKEAARQLASAAFQTIVPRPAPRPNYPQVSRSGGGAQPTNRP